MTDGKESGAPAEPHNASSSTVSDPFAQTRGRSDSIGSGISLQPPVKSAVASDPQVVVTVDGKAANGTQPAAPAPSSGSRPVREESEGLISGSVSARWDWNCGYSPDTCCGYDKGACCIGAVCLTCIGVGLAIGIPLRDLYGPSCSCCPSCCESNCVDSSCYECCCPRDLTYISRTWTDTVGQQHFQSCLYNPMHHEQIAKQWFYIDTTAPIDLSSLTGEIVAQPNDYITQSIQGPNKYGLKVSYGYFGPILRIPALSGVRMDGMMSDPTVPFWVDYASVRTASSAQEDPTVTVYNSGTYNTTDPKIGEAFMACFGNSTASINSTGVAAPNSRDMVMTRGGEADNSQAAASFKALLQRQTPPPAPPLSKLSVAGLAGYNQVEVQPGAKLKLD